MTIPAFTRLRLDMLDDPGQIGRELSRVQDNVGKTVDQVVANPILNGQLLTGITLAVGSNIINHKLGRILLGWLPVRLRASATLYDTQDSNATPALTLLVTSSAVVVADFWVF